jgi:hypothetical protein
MNLLAAKHEVLVDDALRRQLIQVLTFGFRREVCLVAGQELGRRGAMQGDMIAKR